jgi:excinuclease UvrABC nuclease subunit
MDKCIEPCKQACTPEQYAAEAAAVKNFFDTRGESMIIEIGLAREEASSGMQFEKAAALHTQWHKVKAVQALADSIVRPVPKLRAVIVQAAAPDEEHPDHAALFLLEGGCFVGPERLSTLGVRSVREQTSVGSSLFAQPLMLQAVPLEGEPVADSAANSPEERATNALKTLEKKAGKPNDLALLSDHLSLLRRWYYRPEKQRIGEVFFTNEDGTWPIRKILRGAARVVIGDPKPMAETQRDAAKEATKNIQTKILHEGRPDVERTIPVLPRKRKPQGTH